MMSRAMRTLSKISLLLAAVSCGASAPTRPVDETSLVLAYVSQTRSSCDIVLASLDGQSRTLANSCAFQPAWSPDGKRLAFDRPGGEAAPPALWIIDADGTHAAEIAGGRALGHPEWSPDGSRIAALSLSRGTLVLMQPDGTRVSELTATIGMEYDRPSWSPDGTGILFTRLDTLWVVDVNSGAAHVLAVPALRQMNSPRWSPDGSRISVSADAPHRFGTYVMNADGSSPKLLADGNADASPASWSPDGTQLAFASALGDGSTVDVFVVPSDGSTAPRNLTNHKQEDASGSPDWARRR
jgi:Tol biopolymer transport system component